MRIEAHWDQSNHDAEILRFKRGLVRGALKNLSGVNADAKLEDGIHAGTLVHPGWASLHSQPMRETLSLKEIGALINLLDRSNALSLEPDGELRSIFAQSLIRQSQRAEVKRGKSVTYNFAGEDEVERLKPIVEQSLALLKLVWPEQFNLVQRLISHLIFFQAAQEWSSCDTLTFGAVYYNFAFGASAMDLAEGIIHEAGHHSLFIKQTFKALVTNPDTLCVSPLRPEPRPVMGLFHAVFVLRRILEFYERVEKNGWDQQEVPHKRVAQYRAYLAQGLETLCAAACFTPFGQSLFNSLSK